MTKVFISQPMNGRDDEAILIERNRIADACHLKWGDCEIVPSHFADEKDEKSPVYLLGKAIGAMSEADVVVFAPEWYRARGCRVEHHIAQAYFDRKSVFVFEVSKDGTADISCEAVKQMSGVEMACILDAYFEKQANIMRVSEEFLHEVGAIIAKARFVALKDKFKSAGIELDEVREYAHLTEEYNPRKKNNNK